MKAEHTPEFESCYRAHPEEVQSFGRNWCGPPALPHGDETLIARYPKTCKDGQDVEIFCCALPARFYTISVAAGVNSVGRPQHPYQVNTGSGCDKLAADIAGAISGGMLGFEPIAEATKE